MTLDIAWGQRYAATTLCRILCTLEAGKVVSKKEALLWDMEHLDTRWSALLHQVLADRPRGFDADETSRPGSVGQPLALAAYAEAITAHRREGGEPMSHWSA